MTDLEWLQARAADWLDLAFERAVNRMRFGTSDPTGGRGRQLFPIATYTKALTK